MALQSPLRPAILAPAGVDPRAIDASAPEHREGLLATERAGRRQRRMALIALVVSLLVFAAVAPLAQVMLMPVAAFIPAQFSSVARAEFPLKDNDIWVMAGDSITAQHLHSNYFEAFCFARYPELKFAFRNSGVGGHTTPSTLADSTTTSRRGNRP